MPKVTVKANLSTDQDNRRWAALAQLLAGFRKLSPAVYLAMAMPTVIFLTILTPPFQTPDETNHFRRAVQLLRGEVVGHDIPAPGFSGANLPKSVNKVAEAFSYLIAHPEARFSPTVMHDAAATPWAWSDREFGSFANTVIYPPIFYLPSVGALAVARGLGWNPLDAYRLARLTTGILSVGIAALSIGLAGRGRALLFVVLSFPTTLYLFASVSQDALLIACSALAMSICSGAASLDRGLTTLERIGVALLFGAIIAARPPYLVLCFVLATPLVRSTPSRPWSRFGTWLPVATALTIGIGWVLFGARPAQTPMRLESGVSIPNQIYYSMVHPFAFPTALMNTISQRFSIEFAQAVAVIGWSETLFTPFYYFAVAVILVVASGMAMDERRAVLSRSWGVALLAACGICIIGLHAALYLQWTPVGATLVDGFQGRYLVPALMLLAVAVPAAGAVASRTRIRPSGSFAQMSRTLAGIAICAFAAISDFWLLDEVFFRYYG